MMDELVMVALAPVPAGAVRSREAGCPVAPAVNLMLEGDSVSMGALPLLPLPFPLLVLPPQDARPMVSNPVARTEAAPMKNRRR